MAARKDVSQIQDFGLAGLSDSSWSGTSNSVAKLRGFDIHSAPGIVRAAPRLTLDSGAVIDEFCKCSITSTNGRTYWFSSESGKIWEDNNGTYTLVHTTTPAAGQAYCLGAAEYNGYIIWATQNRLHRILATNAEGATEWAANVDEDYATFDVGDTLFHPMIEQNLVLYIGDGYKVAQVNDTTFTADALDLIEPHRIKALGKFGVDLICGTYVSDKVPVAGVFRWDTYSVSFSSSHEIREVGINAIFTDDTITLVQAGLEGNIYIYNGQTLELYKKIPGRFEPGKYARMEPNAHALLSGKILMGLSFIEATAEAVEFTGERTIEVTGE